MPLVAQVIVDSRIRVCLRELPSEVGEELRRRFTHGNPQAGKLGEPDRYETWVDEAGELGPSAQQDLLAGIDDFKNWVSVPRGGMARVRAVLAGAGAKWKVEDARTWSHPEPGFPDHVRKLWDYQERLLLAAERRENCLLHGATGCLAGDSMVTINRAGKGAQMRLDHVVWMFSGGIASGRRWDPMIPTFVRAPWPDGGARLARVVSATASGVREVWELRTERGDAIRATADHRFLTPFGYVALESLVPGDFVLVDESRGGRPTARGEKKPKPYYRVRRVPEHPFAGRRDVRRGGWTLRSTG